MFRWTNGIPYFFNNLKFIEENKRHLSMYLRTWRDMVEDYTSGRNALSMAEVYVPEAGLIPSSYGLIVADYKTHTILDGNCYSTIGIIHSIKAWTAKKDREDKVDQRGYNDYRLIKDFFDKKRIKEAYVMPRHRKTPLDLATLTFDKFAGTIDDYHEIVLDMSPWTLKRFDRRNAESMIKMREEILALGFELTNGEKAAWTRYIKDIRK